MNKFKIGDIVKSDSNKYGYSFDPIKRGIITQIIKNKYQVKVIEGCDGSKKESWELMKNWTYNEENLELLEELKPFEASKNSKELNIDKSKKFIIVGCSFSGMEGDIVNLTIDDNTRCPWFWNENKNKSVAIYWKDLAYAPEKKQTNLNNTNKYMTNDKKIKAFLNANFKVQLFDKKDKDYAIAYKIGNHQSIIATNFFKNIDSCHNALINYCWDEKEINKMNLEITPIISQYEEIKGKVDIIDCKEIREIARIKYWDEEAVDMIGGKGFEIDMYRNNEEGRSYRILNKNKDEWYVFPAWCVVPHFENNQDDKTTEAMELLKKNGYKIIKE